MMITMKASFRVLLVGGATLAAGAALTTPAGATVPYNEGTVTVANPWPLPARALHVGVSSGCSYVNDVPTTPILRVTTHDPEWQRYLGATLNLSSTVPFIHTRADVSWRNHGTGATGTGTESGINGTIPGAQLYEVEPGLTTVTVTITQAPGIPLEIGVVGSRMATGTFDVTVNDCGT